MKIRALLVACLGLLLTGQDYNVPFRPQEPAGGGGGEDFTQRDSCKALWFKFTDGNLASAYDDKCDAAGQDGENTLTTDSADPDVAAGDAPTGAPTGADSVDFDGSTHSSDYPDDNDFDCQSRTVVAWIKNDTTGAVRTILEKGSGAFTGYSVTTDANGDALSPSVAGTFVSTSSIGTDGNTWNFIAFAFDGADTNDAHGYVDGVAAAGSTETDDISSNSAAIDVGSGPVGSGWDGHMLEIGYYCEYLSDPELCQMCRCGQADDHADRSAACNDCTMPEGMACSTS